MDLLELIQRLWAQKVIIVAITVLVTAMAIVYAFAAAPVFQAKATLLPPLPADIAAYNAGRVEPSLAPLTTDDVYTQFRRNLYSQSLRRSFFKDVYLPELSEGARSAPQDQLWMRFNALLSIRVPDPQRPDLLEVSVQHGDPQTAAAWVNRLVAQASQATKADMQRNVRGEVATRIESIERRIASMRSSARQRREDRIAVLGEALVVANAVGLQVPQVTAGRTSSTRELSEFIDGSLTYMRGAKAIEAELAVLQARQSDDPFIPELRSLQEQLSFLRAINVDPDNVAVFRLDSPAEVPQTPIKPRKSLIMAIGLILGGLLGLFVAVVRIIMLRQS